MTLGIAIAISLPLHGCKAEESGSLEGVVGETFVPIVELSGEHLDQVYMYADLRQQWAVVNDHPSVHGYDDSDPLGLHIQGCATELAVAWYLRLPWHAYYENVRLLNGKSQVDVGTKTQVRSTTWEDGCLIVHPSDDDDHTFVGTVWCPPTTVVIVGWLSGRNCKKREHWRSNVRNPAFFVAQRFLNPMPTVITSNDFRIVKHG